MRRPSTGCSRREFLIASGAIAGALAFPGLPALAQATRPAATRPAYTVDPKLAQDWLARWEKNILADARNRYCDREMGEELGWLVSPFLNGFYWGDLATRDSKWVDLLIDWSDAWVKRGVKEPDGLTGWPKADGASTSAMPGLFTDNILGEAMALRPMVLMANHKPDSWGGLAATPQYIAQANLREGRP